MSREAPTAQRPDWWPYRPDPDYRAPARRAVSGVCELSHIFAGRCDGPRRARNWPRIMGYTNAAGRARMHAPGRPRRHHVFLFFWLELALLPHSDRNRAKVCPGTPYSIIFVQSNTETTLTS